MDRQSIGIALGGAGVVGVAFGMARYAYGLTLPDVRLEFGLSEALLGLIASGTFVGYLVGLVAAPRLAALQGPRAPTTVGGVCGVLGAIAVVLAPAPWMLALGVMLAGAAAGWVWAPYSDIVTAVAPLRHQPALLAVIATGTSLGLIGLGLLAWVAPWRLIWAGIGLAAALAGVLNLLVVPRAHARYQRATTSRMLLWRRNMWPLLVYAVLYFAVVTIYFTYASEAIRGSNLEAPAAPLLFLLMGVSGLVGLRTGRLAQAIGAPAVGVAALLVTSMALLLLSVGATSLLLIVISAVLFGMGYVVGASLLAVWAAQVIPDRPGEGFTTALLAGTLASIAAPAVMGIVIPQLGLSTTLLFVAVLITLGAFGLAVLSQRFRKENTGPRL